jgi:hypothetical protein
MLLKFHVNKAECIDNDDIKFLSVMICDVVNNGRKYNWHLIDIHMLTTKKVFIARSDIADILSFAFLDDFVYVFPTKKASL